MVTAEMVSPFVSVSPCDCGACDMTDVLTVLMEQDRMADEIANAGVLGDTGAAAPKVKTNRNEDGTVKARWGVGQGSKPCPLCEKRLIPTAHGLCRPCARVRINALYGVTDGKTPAAMAADYREKNKVAVATGNWHDAEVEFTIEK